MFASAILLAPCARRVTPPFQKAWSGQIKSSRKYDWYSNPILRSGSMRSADQTTSVRTASGFNPAHTPAHPDYLPSSSPAFSTPTHPIQITKQAALPTKSSILPILLPPALLRPLAFRTFTKKHNLTLTSTALQSFATFIGKHCGTGWREEGLAERVLEEIARIWKKNGGAVIVEGDGEELKQILRNLEGCMSGGRVSQQKALNRRGSFAFGSHVNDSGAELVDQRPEGLSREDSQSSLGVSGLDLDDDEEPDRGHKDPRRWLSVVGAFEQPRLVYDAGKKHFEKAATAASLLPSPSHKTTLFRHRYNLIHQRLLRNEAFHTPAVAPQRVPSLQRSSSTMASAQQAYKLTPIANLLGRSGTIHLLLGLLTIAPTGTLAISDLTGSIALDLRHAKTNPPDGAWFTPGMIILVDGLYEEEGATARSALGGGGGVGGTIGGTFIGLSIGGPPCERRDTTLGVSGVNGKGEVSAGGGFGWVDFLGVGSERASGFRMRRLEQSLLGRKPTVEPANGRGRIVILGDVNLDNAATLPALQKILGTYAADAAEDTPMIFVMVGNFIEHAVMAGGGSGGSIEYKEYFDSLASALSEFPTLLQAATFIFVPGDHDPWASAFSAGAATVIPRNAVPELFTSRVRRAFATANAEAEKSTGVKTDGEAVWTTNPSRLSLFGPAQEVVIFRDDMFGRLRRNAIRFGSAGDADGAVGENRNQGGSSQADSNMGAVEESPAHDDLMEVDRAVEAAESQMPTSKSQGPAGAKDPIDDHTAKKLVKTLLDQGYLSPFPLATRPVLWDYANALQLYPLPSALVLVDPEAPPFAQTYAGCHVMNPGRLLVEGSRGVARWVEYHAKTRRGRLMEITY